MAPTGHDDVDAFSAFFYGHASRAVQLARFLGADDPEDVAQEAFCRVFAARDSLEPDRDPGAYLNRVVVNEVRSRARRRSTRERFAPLIATAARDEGPADAHATRRALLQSVAALTPRQREVVVLRYWLDLTLAEIAAATDSPLSTVKSHLARALAALRANQEELR